MNVEINNFEWFCYTDYGYPSGHTMLPLLILEFFNFLLWKKFYSWHFYCKMIFSIFFICLYIFVFFSRIYLGQHTIAQAFYGFLWGLETLLIYKIILKDLINNYLEHLVKSNVYRQRSRDFIILGICFVLALCLPIIVFESL
jgi:membrane-associated phospholipid phosphatase